MYTAKVMAHARRVPWGMATLGFLRSPEILAPAADRGRERERERGGGGGPGEGEKEVGRDGERHTHTDRERVNIIYITFTGTMSLHNWLTHDASAAIEHDGKNDLK